MDPVLRNLRKQFVARPDDDAIVCAYLQACLRSGYVIDISEIKLVSPDIQTILLQFPSDQINVYGYSVDLLKQCVWAPMTREIQWSDVTTEVFEVKWLPAIKMITMRTVDTILPQASILARIQLREGNRLENVEVADEVALGESPELSIFRLIREQYDYQVDEFRLLDYQRVIGRAHKRSDRWPSFYHLAKDWMGPSRWRFPRPYLSDEDVSPSVPLVIPTQDYVGIENPMCEKIVAATQSYHSKGGGHSISINEPYTPPMYRLARMAPKEILNFPEYWVTGPRGQDRFLELKQSVIDRFRIGDIQDFLLECGAAFDFGLPGNRRLVIDEVYFNIQEGNSPGIIAQLQALKELPQFTHIPVWIEEQDTTIVLPE